MFIVICEPNTIYVYGYFGSKQHLCGSQTTFKGTKLVTCMWQISSLLHCSCSQAVFSLIMCDPNTLHVCCDLGAKQLLCYCYFGAKPLLCLLLFEKQTIFICIVICGIKQLQGLRLFVSQTTFICMVIWETNNLNLEAKQPSREPQVEPSCASSRQISSLLHVSWSQAVSVSNIMCDPKHTAFLLWFVSKATYML